MFIVYSNKRPIKQYILDATLTPACNYSRFGPGIFNRAVSFLKTTKHTADSAGCDEICSCFSLIGEKWGCGKTWGAPSVVSFHGNSGCEKAAGLHRACGVKHS